MGGVLSLGGLACCCGSAAFSCCCSAMPSCKVRSNLSAFQDTDRSDVMRHTAVYPAEGTL